MADQKYCNRCNAPIKWPPFVPGKKSHPLNMDGTEHNCQAQTGTTIQPKEDSRVGIYKGISRGNINLTLKNGSILVTAANEDLLKCLSSPDTSIKDGMKVKITFDKDGKAKIIEPCQDQPAPANPTPQTTGTPQEQTKPPAENRTSPAGIAAPHGPEPRKKSPAEERRAPTDEELLAMIYSPDTYWKGKAIMEIMDLDRIRKQIEFKNRIESANAAIAYHEKQPVDIESVLKTANRIYDYATGKKPAGVQ